MNTLSTAPVISIILPTYNGDVEKIKLAIHSIKDQSYSDFECIIVDDSSEYKVINFLQSISKSDQRFCYFRGKGAGLAAALNLGLSMSRGEFIARVDDTDISSLNRFELQIAYLRKNHNIGVVGSNYRFHRSGISSIRNYPEYHFGIMMSFLFSCPIAHSSVMIRRSILLNFNGYDETFFYCEDLELWLRMIRGGIKFGNIQRVLLYFDNDLIIRSRQHFLSNSRARFKHSVNIFISISFLISLLHFLIPKFMRKKIKRIFE
jgi:glycosyltransferase involved in cell wall biosynthesis